MGLLQLSEQFRDQLLNLNLPTPSEDVQNYLDTFGNTVYANYQDDLGNEPIINWYQAVIDAGSISDHDVYLQNLLSKNKVNNPNDPSDNLFGSFMADLGQPLFLNTYNVTNQENVSQVAIPFRNDILARNKPLNPNDPSDTGAGTIPANIITNYQADLGVQRTISDYTIGDQPNITSLVDNFITTNKNRYEPNDLEYAKVLITELTNKTYQPYTHLGTNGIIQSTDITNIFNNPTYDPSTFLKLDERITIPRILIDGDRVLEGETLLMNIAATQVKFHFESRINQNLERETLGKLNIFNATNPITAINILKDPFNNFFIKNWDITTGLNPIQDAGRFAATLAGIEIPVSPFEGRTEVLTPKCFGTTIGQDALGITEQNNSLTNLFRDFTGRSLQDDHSDFLLSKTGAGQKSQLYGNLKFNKYAPDYKPVYDSQFFQGIDGLKEKINGVAGFLGLGAGTRPLGNYYIGLKRNGGPIGLLSDNDGDQVRSLQALTDAFKTGNDGFLFDEPTAGEYGQQTGNIIWGLGTEEDITNSELFTQNPEAISLMSGSKVFRECSILDKTQRLVQKGGILDSINQTKTKFSDGTYTYSKGSAVRGVEVTTDNLGRKSYKPTDEFCRTWTKTNPYTRVKDLLRSKELLRRERNSVLDANGNLNIAPTDLNIKKVSGVYDLINDERTDGFDELRARKYMFSIENLAWTDSEMFNNLPPYEKGPNGGRIMWFPPYALDFDENTSTNWSSHIFLGRPEPIYTYNSTERIGNLSFQIVVDHPTILNILVNKEFENVSDSDVDDVINSFWAGCLEFDIFELARIWGVYSTSELEYFKNVVNTLKKTQSNDIIRNSNTVSETFGGSEEVTKVVDIDESIVTNLKKNYAYFPHFEDGGGNFYADISNVYSSEIILPQPNNVLSYNTTLTNPSEPFSISDELYGLLNNLIDLINTQQGKNLTIEFETSISPYEETIINDIITFGNNRFLSFALSLINDLNVSDEIKKFTYEDKKQQFAKNVGLPTTYVQFETINGDTITFRNSIKTNTNTQILKGFAANLDTYEQYNKLENNNTYLCVVDSFSSGGTAEVCSIYSLPASKSRYVKVKNVKAEIIGEPLNATQTTEGLLDEQNRITVTKRDIAQRLLSKLITEGDYFKVLQEDSPFIYKSLREKLKYFSPAFHSTTPEGLNSRLNFLQQCMRPGDTIKNPDGSSCDANNTSFGKPPICVLRIGDFYNTKIVIDNLNIAYENTWDMNPEGIGMQPNIATVNMTVKYFGGHGLRKPVEKLQNALSFDYYANTEIYDERSFANNDTFERNLINQETDFFNSGELDLVDIIEVGENTSVTPTIPNTIGDLVNSEIIDLDAASLLNQYTENKRLTTYNFNYKSTFNSLYTNYTNYINQYINYQHSILELGDYSSLLANQVFFNDRPFTQLTNTTNNANNILDINSRINALSNIKNYIQTGVSNKRVGELSNKFFSFLAIKLHLYPQEKLETFSSGSDGLTGYTIGGGDVINIDNYTGIVLPKPPELSITEVENFLSYADSFEDKIDAGLLSTLTKDFAIGGNISTKFNSLTSKQRKEILSTIKSKFLEYKQNIALVYETYIKELKDSYDTILIDLQKIATITSGVDGINENNEFYEIIPNGKVISGDINKFFNYEPYSEIYSLAISAKYTTLSSNLDEDIISTDSVTINALLDPLQAGNFDYLKKQSDSPFTDNNLPIYDYDAKTWSINNGQIIDLSGTTSTIDSDYTMTYTFEKVNFEVFNFGQITTQNITKDISPMGDRTEIQDVVSSEIKFTFGNTDLSTVVDNYDEVYGYLMFKDRFNNTKLNSLSISPDNVSSKYPDIYNRLNDFVEIQRELTADDYNYIKTNIDTNATDSIKGYKFNVKSIEELIFMDFLVSLTDNGFVSELKSNLENIKLTRVDIKNSDSKKRTIIKNGNEFVDGFINNINGLVSQVGKDYSKLNKYFNDNLNTYESFMNTVNNDLITRHQNNSDYILKFRKTDKPNDIGKSRLNEYTKINKL